MPPSKEQLALPLQADGVYVYDCEDNSVAGCYCSEHAQQIVRACNSHAKLVAACQATECALCNLERLITGELSREWDELYGADYEATQLAHSKALAAISAAEGAPDGN